MRYPRFAEKSILIVEDNPSFSYFLDKQLAKMGFNVSVCQSEQDAMKLIDEGNAFHIALVDMYIPDVRGKLEPDRVQRGEQLCYFLNGRNPNLLIIGMSNHMASAPRTPLPSLFSDFISKQAMPENEDPIVLWETLDACLQNQGQRVPRSFIVHGHDEVLTLAVKNMLQNELGLSEPTILRDQADRGRTIIEKFEAHAGRADLAFVCLTPDDEIVGKGAPNKRRSRPNVIFELGFFYAKFQRERGRVILLYKGDTELPSDLSGLVYIDVSNGLAEATLKIKKELLELGFNNE